MIIHIPLHVPNTIPPNSPSSLNWEPVFWPFAQAHIVWVTLSFLISRIIWKCLTNKRWAKGRLYIKVIMILNAAICLIFGIVLFSAILEEIVRRVT